MGYSGNSGAQDRGSGQCSDERKGSFGRLKAATGFAKSQPDASTPLVLSAQDALAPAAPAQPAIHEGPSVLSANVEMTGSFSSPNALHVYGSVDGNVRAADLTIFAGGSVKGDVVADSVQVHGSVEGRVYAKKVQLCSGAVVRGDIVHGSLGIDTGSTFEGVSKRSENPAAEVKPAASKRNGSTNGTAATPDVRYSSPS